MNLFEGATLIGAVGAVIGAVAATLSWWHTRPPSAPDLVFRNHGDLKGPGEWSTFKLTIENRTPTVWHIERLVISRPRKVAGVGSGQMFKAVPGAQTNMDIQPEFDTHASRSIPINKTVESAGTPAQKYISSGDTASEIIYLRMPSGAPRVSLSMRVFMSSMEATSRRKVRTVKRVLTPSAASVKV